jgi:protein-disulfide isomerase
MPTPSYRTQKPDSSHAIRLVIIGSVGIALAVIIFLAVQSKPAPLPDYSFPARAMGNPNAKVVVEEFADYQCPYCGLFATTLQPVLISRYVDTGKIRFIFRAMAFVDQNSINQESHMAALAAFCAGDQNHFWEYHDLVFHNQKGENQGNFLLPNLMSFAMQLNLDSVALDQCLKSQKYVALLQSDMERADALKIESTPSFAINTVVIKFSQDLQTELFAAIDRALAAAGGNS